MRLHEELTDKAYQQIEPQAAKELAELNAALDQVTDPTQRAALKDAALAYAFSVGDAALAIGFQMREDPGAWLFVEE